MFVLISRFVSSVGSVGSVQNLKEVIKMNLIENEVFKINLIGNALFNFLYAQKIYKKKIKSFPYRWRLISSSKKRHTKRIEASSCVKLQNGSVQESIKHYNYSTLKNPLKEGVLM